MAAATGTVVIASAGGSFDSADYPRFVLGDGTNSLTFVIDNHARGLQTRFDGEFATAYTASTQLPFEDSQRGRLAVPTLDNDGGAQKAAIMLQFTDGANIDNLLQRPVVNKADNSGFRAITARTHFVLRDADDNEIKVGFGQSNATAITNQGAVLIAKYGSSGSPRFWLYRESASSRNYFIRVVSLGTNLWKAHQSFFGAFKHAYQSNLINVDVSGIDVNGNLMSASVGNDTYTSAENLGLLLQYETAGFKGNACSLTLMDPENSMLSSSTERVAMSWGYEEYATSTVMSIQRHGTAQQAADNPQYWGHYRGNDVYFRGGTIDGSDAALSTANIAEAIKEMVNGSKLGITATRSSSTVNLTNDTDGDSGNVTITTTNRGALFSVTGMSNAGGGGGSGGGTSIMARTKIQSKLIAVGGISKDNISSGSVGIGHLNFSEATNAQKASGSLGPDDLLAIYDFAAGSTKAVPLEHFKAFLSASVITNLTASGDVLLGDASSDEVNVAGRFISSLVPKTDGLNDLGTSALAWNTVFAESGSFSDNVGIGNNLTVSDTISGSTINAQALTADAFTVGGVVASSITASNGVLLGSSNADDLAFLGGQITDLVPQNDNKVALGSVSKRYSLVSAMSASIAGNVGVVGTVTAGGVTSAGTISGSTMQAALLTVDRIAGSDIDGTSGTFSGTISGSTINAQALTADAFTVGGVVASSITASNGVLLGSSNADDLSFLGGLITDLVPQNDSQVDLGSSSKQFAEAHIDTGNIDTVVSTILTASQAKIGTLDVDTIVSRTVTKESLEVKNNLIIAALSGSKAGNFVGSGFQVGGVVGIEGTGSAPLMSMTLGSRGLTGNSMIVNVDGQAGASFMSGGATIAALGTAGMRFGVTGSISGSLIQAKRLEAGHLALRGGFTATNVSGATVNAHDLNADDAVIGGLQLSSLTASNGVILGSSNADDLSFLGGQITDLVPQNDNKVALGSATKRYSLISAMSASIAGAIGAVGTVTAGGFTTAGNIASTGESATISGSTMQAHQIFLNKLNGTGIVTQDNLQTGSVLTPAILDANVTTAKLANTSVTKAKLNADVIQNNSDAHGGLVFTSGRLSVGFRKDVFVRADGSNISGTVPTHGMFATKAVPTPYTTASLGAQPVSGTLMVYLNGVLLHGDYAGQHQAHGGAQEADFHLLTGSANAYKILLNSDLALDSDDILTVTYLSGSGVVS